jgi:integrase
VQAKITKTVVDKVVPPIRGQSIIWDTELKGFGLRVTPSRKTYVAQSRVAGKSRRVTLGLHGVLTPDEGRRAAKEALVLMGRGVDINGEKERKERYSVTLGEVFVAYRGNRKLTANTLRDYEESMKNGFAEWNDMSIRSITRDMISLRFDELSKVSLARTNLKFRFLRALFNFAMEMYSAPDGQPLVPSNPCNVLKARHKWHRIERRKRHVEETALATLVQVLHHQSGESPHRVAIKDLCAFLLLTGCREQEAARLRWSDVDLAVGRVTIPITKNGDPHVMPIGPWLLRLLTRRRRGATSLFVFPAPNKHGHLKNHRKGILAICKETGIEFRLHDLRRTFATVVNDKLAGDQSYFTIKRLLNHRVSDVTAGYVQLPIEKLRAAMVLIERHVVGDSPDLDCAVPRLVRKIGDDAGLKALARQAAN